MCAYNQSVKEINYEFNPKTGEFEIGNGRKMKHPSLGVTLLLVSSVVLLIIAILI